MNCKNKKIISILIASGILLSPNNAQAMGSMVDFINEDSKAIEENIDKIEKEDAIQSEDDTNIVPGLVHEIILGDGEFVPDLTDNPNKYETIIATIYISIVFVTNIKSSSFISIFL